LAPTAQEQEKRNPTTAGEFLNIADEPLGDGFALS
jgi:hypothetical protein